MKKSKKRFNVVLMETHEDLFLHREEAYNFPAQTYSGLASLCMILKGIQDRLIGEGYSIINGTILPWQNIEIYEENNQDNR